MSGKPQPAANAAAGGSVMRCGTEEGGKEGTWRGKEERGHKCGSKQRDVTEGGVRRGG